MSGKIHLTLTTQFLCFILKEIHNHENHCLNYLVAFMKCDSHAVHTSTIDLTYGMTSGKVPDSDKILAINLVRDEIET